MSTIVVFVCFVFLSLIVRCSMCTSHRKSQFWRIKRRWNMNSGDFIRPWRWSVFCLRPKSSKWKMFSSKIIFLKIMSAMRMLFFILNSVCFLKYYSLHYNELLWLIVNIIYINTNLPNMWCLFSPVKTITFKMNCTSTITYK